LRVFRGTNLCLTERSVPLTQTEEIMKNRQSIIKRMVIIIFIMCCFPMHGFTQSLIEVVNWNWKIQKAQTSDSKDIIISGVYKNVSNAAFDTFFLDVKVYDGNGKYIDNDSSGFGPFPMTPGQENSFKYYINITGKPDPLGLKVTFQPRFLFGSQPKPTVHELPSNLKDALFQLELVADSAEICHQQLKTLGQAAVSSADCLIFMKKARGGDMNSISQVLIKNMEKLKQHGKAEKLGNMMGKIQKTFQRIAFLTN